MERFREFVEDHKLASALALVALLAFVGLSAAQALRVAERRQAEQDRQGTEQQAPEEEGEEDADAVVLSESQQALVDGYDAKTTTLIRTLGKGVWSANNGRNTVLFHDTYYTETNGKEVTDHPYAIAAVEYGNNGDDTEIDIIAVETDTGTHLVTYTFVRAADSEDTGASTLASSTLFSLTDAPYTRSDTVIEMDVTGLNDEVTDLLGTRKDLVAELSEWCSVHYPAATTAAWTGTATIDWNEGIVVTSFSLGSDEPGDGTGPAATVVSVTYTSETGTYEFGS